MTVSASLSEAARQAGPTRFGAREVPSADRWQRDMEKSQGEDWFASFVAAARWGKPESETAVVQPRTADRGGHRTGSVAAEQPESFASPQTVRQMGMTGASPRPARMQYSSDSPCDYTGATRFHTDRLDAPRSHVRKPLTFGVPTQGPSMLVPQEGMATSTLPTALDGAGFLPGREPLSERTGFTDLVGVSPDSRTAVALPFPAAARSVASQQDPLAGEVEAPAGKVCAADPDRSGKSQGPLRVTALWTGEGVSIWVGADAAALVQVNEIAQAIRQRLGSLGVRLLSLTCNGRPLTYGSEPLLAADDIRQGVFHGD